VSSRRFFVVPHTHWDREWYRPFEYFRLALGDVVDGVIGVLERDPAFVSFTLDGQAIVLEDYLEVRPHNEARLRRLLAAGRIEVGPSYVLPDEFLVGAESLVRNLLIGRAVCERLGIEPSPVGYMPDSFGHPLQLPQVLRGFGIGSFIFSRGLGDELDDVGVVFRWRAPDGSEVLAFQQLADYSNFAGMLSAEAAERRVQEILDEFGELLAAAGVDQVLLCNGSDHLPVVPELPALCAELERRFAGNRFGIAGFADYVRAVGDVEVPVWEGELLGSRLQNVLRGVNSARLYVKQANERAERRLLAVETLSALRMLRDGEPFRVDDFTLAWRELLKCHPHDTICGCSCDEVHRDALNRYASLERTLSVLEDRALGGCTPDEEQGGVGVVNPLPEGRRELVEVPGAEPQLVELDGFSARTVELTPARPVAPRDGATIENTLFRVDAAPDGALTLVDKHRGTRFERLHVLEDEPDMGDLYTFCPVAGAAVWRASTAEVRVLSDGPLVSELEVRCEAQRPAGLDDGAFTPARETAPLRVRTVVRLVEGIPRVAFRTTIDNVGRDHRLRVVFAAAAAIDAVRAEGHFALIRRSVPRAQPRTAWAEPPDPTDHTLGAVAAGPLGLLTKGLPEYEARRGESGAELCLTLLRCVGVIAQPGGTLSTRPGHAGPAVPTPEGQCVGRHVCEYALLPGADALDDVALLRASQHYRSGFLTTRPARFDRPLRVEGDIVFSCLKGAQDGDGVILRCFNPSAAPVSARIDGEVSVSRTRLDETSEDEQPDDPLRVRPGEIATFRLRPL
jgi:alpha-mannosidase